MQALNILLQYFIDFLIWMIKCEPNEGIVRTTFGKNPKQYMKPGPYLRIPIIHDITSINITEQVLETPPQSIGLDNKNFLVTPLVRYKVISPIDAVFKVESWESSLEAAVAKATYKFFQKNQNKKWSIDHYSLAVNTEVHSVCLKFGVEILNVGLLNMVEHKAYRIVGDHSNIVEEEDE